MDEQIIESESNANIKIGDYLRQKREEKGYTLKIISQHTRINATLLDKLERNRLEELPSKAYVAGFVKSYAKTLGLNEQESLDILDQNYEDITPSTLKSQSPITKQMNYEKGLISNKPTRSTSDSEEENKLLIPGIILGIVLIIFIFAVINSGADKKVEEQVAKEDMVVEEVKDTSITPKSVTASTPLKDKTETENNSINESSDKAAAEEMKAAEEEAKRLAEEKKAAEEEAKKLAEEKKAAEEAKRVEEERKAAEAKKLAEEKKAAEEAKRVKEERKAAEAKKLADEKKAADSSRASEGTDGTVSKKKVKEKAKEIEFKDIPMPMFNMNSSASKEELGQWLPTRYKNAAVADKENIYIHATDGETWLTYKSDDNPTKKFILRQGRSVLIRGNDVRIFLGNANVTKIFYNNQLIDPITNSGVKSLVFPVEKANELKLPLFIYNNDGTVTASDEYLTQN